MIDSAVLKQVRAGIVAVGFTRTPWKEALDPYRDDGPDYEILGTGFMVTERTIMTNRHVLVALEKAAAVHALDADRLFLSFVFESDEGLAHAYSKVGEYTYSPNPDLDVGFVDLPSVAGPVFNQIQPLVIFDDASELSVGQGVAVCGYPYGTSMLEREGKRYRFGPVLQQGFISALSPYDGYRVTELLLDVRTAGGMSGSPVFLPGDGTVIGIHYAGWEATTALAVPITTDKIARLLEGHERGKEYKRESSGTPGSGESVSDA